ncbi:uncharacterized protein [Choristoneura fumiferana]|uniref:uncharacterized protein n=1 Tax=Choristoneura fumiferana TaxID=7141 RepID=UPI003D15B232
MVLSQSVIEDNAGWPQNYNADQIASVTRGGSLPRPPSIIPCPAHTPIPPPPPPPPLTIPPHRAKHVSFARSHTLTTFDDSVMPAAVSSGRFRRDCERLIDGRVIKGRSPSTPPRLVSRSKGRPLTLAMWSSAYSGMVDCFVKTSRQEGIKALYCG